ncbi:sensor histidine kinase [bacterium]|nr:sensor histidine kinase [bacterium]
MKDLADHIFDILENSVTSEATEVKVILGLRNKRFSCRIKDNGRGIKNEDVTDPFVTSRKERKVGLGLSLLKKTAENTNGFLRISRLEGNGTFLEFETDISHIDAKPFGDLAKVFVDAMRSWPDVDFEVLIKKEKSQNEPVLNTKEIRDVMDCADIQHKEIQDFVYQSIDKELKKIGINTQFGEF